MIYAHVSTIDFGLLGALRSRLRRDNAACSELVHAKDCGRNVSRQLVWGGNEDLVFASEDTLLVPARVCLIDQDSEFRVGISNRYWGVGFGGQGGSGCVQLERVPHQALALLSRVRSWSR